MDMSEGSKPVVDKQSYAPAYGCIALFVDNWHRISQDPWVRETVTVHRLELATTPVQCRIPGGVNMKPARVRLVSKDVQDLAAKGATTPCRDNREVFFRQFFLVTKLDGSRSRSSI